MVAGVLMAVDEVLSVLAWKFRLLTSPELVCRWLQAIESTSTASLVSISIVFDRPCSMSPVFLTIQVPAVGEQR